MMRSTVLVCCVLSVAFLAQAKIAPKRLFDNSVKSSDPDCYVNASQMIAANGYPVEEYSVTTEDGYILGVQRIPGPKGSKPTPGAKSASGKVAYLQHGLFSSSIDFLVNQPSESLGYILADAGYDVWLGNVRGNFYSRRHKTLSPSDIKFWDFTYDEFITYDVPAMINKALNVSGQESLYYAGHSQGTMVMFGLLSDQPEFAKKIRAFAALAPVANVTNIKSPVRYLAPATSELDWVLEELGEGELLPSNKLMRTIAETVCKAKFSEFICEDTLMFLNGMDSKQLNETRLPVFLCHFPSGSSTRNLAHFGQGIENARFRKYDFGKAGNQKKYGQDTPPDYDVSKIQAPVGLFWSENDWLADPKDVDSGLRGRLTNLQLDFCVSDKEFTHVDFLIGIHANTMVYPALKDFFAKF